MNNKNSIVQELLYLAISHYRYGSRNSYTPMRTCHRIILLCSLRTLASFYKETKKNNFRYLQILNENSLTTLS